MDKRKNFLSGVIKIFLLCLGLQFNLTILVRATELDVQPPSITIVEPIANSVVKEARPWIRVLVDDYESGVDVQSIVMSVDGIDISHLIIIEEEVKSLLISYLPPVEMLSGNHRIALEAKDLAGNVKRAEWNFIIEAKKTALNYGISLTNTLSYVVLPISRLNDTTNLSFNMQLPYNQRFTLQAQTNITDWPSGAREPNLGNLYASLVRYALSWQTNYFDFYHGHITLPFNSSLLQFGMGFKGSHISGKGKTAINGLSLFKGVSASSSGLGLSVTNNIGGLYDWRTKKSTNQIYAIHMDTRQNKINIIGLHDERTFKNGFLHSEFLYGLGDTNGGCLRLQGATELWGILWNGDLSLGQENNPVANLTSVPSGKGGTYRMALYGDKFLSQNNRFNFGYWQSGDNLNGREDKSYMGQGWQVGYQGSFQPNFLWQASYSGGSQRSVVTTGQHFLRLGIRESFAESSWNNSLSISSLSGGKSVRAQWSFGYNKLFTSLGLNTNSTIQVSYENKNEAGSTKDIKLWIGGDRGWLSDKLKSRLTLEYQNTKENIPGSHGPRKQALRLNGSLGMGIAKAHDLSVGGKVSFWEDSSDTVVNGVDFGLNFMWRVKIF